MNPALSTTLSTITMTTPTLLPCPFCGGTELGIRTDLQRSIAYVVCSNCDAQGPPASFAEMLWEKEDAAAGWNQRSAIVNHHP